jgi:hypothetical protein
MQQDEGEMTEEPRRVDRGRGAVWAIVALSVSAVAVLGACTSEVPRASDPLVSATTGPSPLPPNVGPSDCHPPSSVAPLDGDTIEIHGAASPGASLWMRMVAPRPFPLDQDRTILWRMPGSAGLRLVAVGPDGALVRAADVAPTTAPSWDRPGDAWTSTLRFPTGGCWRINVSRGQAHGDVWLEIP